jgi:type II secretory pathway pseudopilin PulG
MFSYHRGAMKKTTFKIKKNNGSTLVELIVCFALLAIFLVSASLSLSGTTKTYYQERKTMSAYTVADMVLSEIQNDIQTMEKESDSGYSEGYVKLRNYDEASQRYKTVPIGNGTVPITGKEIEFVESNENGTMRCVQIDTRRFDNTLQVLSDSGYLTVRYYTMNSKTNYYSSTDDGGNEEERLGINSYNGFVISLDFTLNTTDSEVNYIAATVTVYNKPLGSNNVAYSKTKYMQLQNKVIYNSYRSTDDDNINGESPTPTPTPTGTPTPAPTATPSPTGTVTPIPTPIPTPTPDPTVWSGQGNIKNVGTIYTANKGTIVNVTSNNAQWKNGYYAITGTDVQYALVNGEKYFENKNLNSINTMIKLTGNVYNYADKIKEGGHFVVGDIAYYNSEYYIARYWITDVPDETNYGWVKLINYNG